MSPTTEHVDVRELIPAEPDIDMLRDISQGCTGCDLYKSGTQTVFGEGDVPADLMLVGEQPGDQEDKQGHPFVGPAGRLLHSALDDADLREVRKYVTNVVKHFKWVERGKRRIHKKPSMGEVRACSPWLEAEIEVVRPRALVCLGATAAQALLGRDFRVTEKRGELLESALAPVVMATVHPSSILRGDPEDRASALDAFTRDLAGVAAALR
ncbi:MAG TPA: UdgX family uracil-DNA binding protein [Actinomycetota bacterium]|jgi:uracil-DNA glycosylase family protein|nr:UdgX family uracil-DNA binding protein [Actinomycetota bacterium]